MRMSSKRACVLFFLIPLMTHCTSSSHSPQSSSPVKIEKRIEVKSIRNDGLDADFFLGRSDKPQKAIILLGGSEGGKDWSENGSFIRELMDQGCCVLSLGYFGPGDLPRELRAIPLEYFAKAFHWLSEQKEAVIPNEYALIGVSRGAELALLLGSRYSEVKTVVAIAPSCVVFPGPPTGLLDALQGQHSAWSSRGQEITFVPVPYSWTTVKGMISGGRRQMFEKALERGRNRKEATIPAEKIQGPILLISFTRDQVWPSTPMSQQIMQRLHNHAFHYPYKHISYNAGHSKWNTPACRTEILSFLGKHFLTLVQSPQPPENKK